MQTYVQHVCKHKDSVLKPRMSFLSSLSFPSFRYTLPVTDGKANVTILDTQIRKLRSRFLTQIHEAAMKMRSEATDVKSTLLEIEDWLDKLMQLTEEVDTSELC